MTDRWWPRIFWLHACQVFKVWSGTVQCCKVAALSCLFSNGHYGERIMESAKRKHCMQFQLGRVLLLDFENAIEHLFRSVRWYQNLGEHLTLLCWMGKFWGLSRDPCSQGAYGWTIQIGVDVSRRELRTEQLIIEISRACNNSFVASFEASKLFHFSRRRGHGSGLQGDVPHDLGQDHIRCPRDALDCEPLETNYCILCSTKIHTILLCSIFMYTF